MPNPSCRYVGNVHKRWTRDVYGGFREGLELARYLAIPEPTHDPSTTLLFGGETGMRSSKAGRRDALLTAVLGAVRTMHRMVARAIEARRQEAAGGADDLLDHMLKTQDPETGRRMSPTDLLHNMQFFIVAGHETTALALSWSLLLLALHPEAQERAQAEARAALGGSPAGADHMEATHYVKQVIEEAMRLYPPVGMLARNVRRADTLGGREILPNDVLFLPIYALHRHQMWWERPNEFDPDRFLPEAVRARDRYLYLPFGAGPRVCVGANFAMMQAHIILATLLARFRFELGPNSLPTPTMSMTVRPDTGVRLAVKRI